MSNVVTLDYLKKKADEKYAPYEIEMEFGTVKLQSPIRLPKTKRAEVMGLADQFETLSEKDEKDFTDEDTDAMHGLMLAMIRACADDEKLAEILNDELREDIAVTQIVFEEWFEKEEVGEASNSSDE